MIYEHVCEQCAQVCDDKECYIVSREIHTIIHHHGNSDDGHDFFLRSWGDRWNALVDNNFGCHHEERSNPTTDSLLTAGACSFNKGRQDLPTRKQPRMSPAICKQPLSTTRCTTPALSTATSPRRQWPALGETQPCQSCPSRSMMSSIYQTTQ